MQRRLLLKFMVAGPILVAGKSPPALGQSPQENASVLTQETLRAIQRGLEYLAKRQAEDGSLGSGGYKGNVAVTALGGMAFMANGSTPQRGPYGEIVSQAIKYILRNVQDSGFIVEPDAASPGPMYGHGFSSLFLAECYGMLPGERVRMALRNAIKLITETQNAEGGWRYFPQRSDADLSVTVCQVMALRAARNAGIHVPNQTIYRSVDYVKRCQNPDGGFMYQLPGGPSGFERSAAGVVALQSAGIYEGAEIRRGLDYLMRFLPTSGDGRKSQYFYYGHYYAAQAMWHAGGNYWQRWYPASRDVLLELQRADGSWFDMICPEYGTAMACLALQMPENYLPIFQR